ncbi:amino acid permease, partial [bacterium]|nr:amino acid permease [bacterium]
GLFWIPQIFLLAELGTAYPQQGFGYTYLKKAGSKPFAFLYVWTVFWTSDTPSITIIAMSASSALAYFYPPLDGTFLGKSFAALIILSLAAIHYRDVKRGGDVQIGLTLAKLSPLALLILVGLFYLDSGNLSWIRSAETAESGWFALLGAGIAATTWSYAGFPNILYMAGEVKKPGRNLPKALIGSAVGVMVAYVLIALGTSAIVPHEELVAFSGRFANPFLYLPLFSRFAAGFLAIAAFVSMIGATNACIMVQPRIEYAIARDGLFFKPFAHVHPKYKTPDYSILLQSGLAVILIFVGNIESLLGYFTLSYVVQNALIYVVYFKLRRLPDYSPSYRMPIWPVMAVLAIATQLYLCWGTFKAYPLGGIITAAVLIVTGFPVYFYFRKKSDAFDTTATEE